MAGFVVAQGLQDGVSAVPLDWIAATTLCALHYFTCSIYAKSMEALGYSKKAELPLRGKAFIGHALSMHVCGVGTPCTHGVVACPACCFT